MITISLILVFTRGRNLCPTLAFLHFTDYHNAPLHGEVVQIRAHVKEQYKLVPTSETIRTHLQLISVAEQNNHTRPITSWIFWRNFGHPLEKQHVGPMTPPRWRDANRFFAKYGAGPHQSRNIFFLNLRLWTTLHGWAIRRCQGIM